MTSSFPHSTEQKWPLGTNYNMELQSKTEMLFESMYKCRIRIPLEILRSVDLKILKIGLEMAELALFCLFFLSGIVFFFSKFSEHRFRSEKI